jgi:REP element-mobilizing transposase RayT
LNGPDHLHLAVDFRRARRLTAAMHRNKTGLYAHLMLNVADQNSKIHPDMEYRFHRQLSHEAGRRDCTMLAIGGMPDHVHLLFEFPTSLALLDLIKHLKTSSSQFANTELQMGGFHWDGPFGVSTVSPWEKRKLIAYIQDQKQHHAEGTTKAQLEFPRG